METAAGWQVYDGEPSLGWSGHGTGWSEGEGDDDREQDAGDEREMENEHFDYGEFDGPLHIPGGGSVSQYEDGWRADPNHVPPVKTRKKGGRGKTSQVSLEVSENVPSLPMILFQREAADSTPMPRYEWNDQWTGNLPPEAFEGLVPEISMHRSQQ